VLALALAAAASPSHVAAGDVAEVKIGLIVTSLARINPADGSFEITGYVWTIDPAGILDPENQLVVLTRSAELSRIQQATLPGGATFTALKLRATVDQAFDLRDFPFDRQTLRVNFETELPVDVLRLVPDRQDTRIADFLVVAGWRVTGLRLQERAVEYDTQLRRWGAPTFSRLSLLIDVERKRSPLVIDKFVGYAMALMITALIFFVPTDQFGVRIGMSTSAVFAAVGNRYGLDALLGFDTSFGLAEVMSLTVFLAIFGSIAATVVVFELGRLAPTTASRRANLALGLAVVVPSLGVSLAALLAARG
jgi:hypothetical protein